MENGLNPCFGETFHCLAQAPRETVVRVAVHDKGDKGDKNVAYETCMLSTLRPGYRVFHLRSPLGTRLEACFLFVHISTGVEPNSWVSGMAIQKQLEDSEARPRRRG